jgi:hypothetical protein
MRPIADAAAVHDPDPELGQRVFWLKASWVGMPAGPAK